VIEINTSALKLRTIVSADIRDEFEDIDAYFYGLKDAPDRSDISIASWNDIPAEINAVKQLFLGAGLRVTVRGNDEEQGDVDEYEGLNIGLNRRIREDVPLAKRIVTTILTALRGNLAYDCKLAIVRPPSPTAPVATLEAPRRRRVRREA
jgi:hypothetical protein